MIKDVWIDVSAIVPGDGSSFYVHGAKDGRIVPDRFKHGATQIDVQVNPPLDPIFKRDTCAEAFQWLNCLHTYQSLQLFHHSYLFPLFKRFNRSQGRAFTRQIPVCHQLRAMKGCPFQYQRVRSSRKLASKGFQRLYRV